MKPLIKYQVRCKKHSIYQLPSQTISIVTVDVNGGHQIKTHAMLI